MLREIAFTCGEQSWNRGLLVEINPQPAHRIMHAWRYAHWHFARIGADKLFVNIENSTEFYVENFRFYVRYVKIYNILTINSEMLIYADIEYFSRSNISRYQVSIGGIFFFEKIPRFSVFVGPDTPTFTTGRFTNETVFILSRDSGWMDLDKFAIGIKRTLFINACCSIACVDS